MSDGWEAFLTTGKVTDYLKAKAQEQTGEKESGLPARALRREKTGGARVGKALCGTDESCRIM